MKTIVLAMVLEKFGLMEVQPGEQRKKYKVRSSNWYRFEHKNEEEIDFSIIVVSTSV